MIKIVIVGTGGMAKMHAEAYAKNKGCKIVAAVDPIEDKLKEFCEKFHIKESYSSVEELLENCTFDASSVVTPDSFHLSCALPLINANKHVLCEKPLAPNASDAKKLMDAAKKMGTINMVNFSYRNNAVLHKAKELVESGELGNIMHFEAHYLQTWLTSSVWGDWKTTPSWLWRLSSSHGSKGVLGDVGVHIVDLTTYIANEKVRSVNALLKTFKKTANDKIGEYTLDANDSAFMRIELEGGGVGTINVTRYATGQQNSLALNLYGTKGALKIDLDKSGTELEVCLGKDLDTAEWKTLKLDETENMYNRFINSIQTGVNDDSNFERGWEIQRVLDASFESDKIKQTITI